jgi:antirestriction protein
MTDLYEKDYVAWTREQAAALRCAAERRANAGLDYEHLAKDWYPERR